MSSRPFAPGATGTWYGLDEQTYRAAPGVNISNLKKMARTPAHYLAGVQYPLEPTETMEFGTLVHLAVLEPNRLAQSYVVRPDGLDFRSKEGKAWKEAQTVQILTPEQDHALQGITRTIQTHPTAASVLAGGQKEVSVFRHHRDTRLLLKGRIDCLTEDANGFRTIIDVKTTQDASPGEFARSVAKFRYDAQAAFYMDLTDAEFFLFVAVEKEPPYGVGVYQLDAAAIENGRRSYETWLQRLWDCQSTDTWPSYPTEIQTISLPKWAMDAAA